MASAACVEILKPRADSLARGFLTASLSLIEVVTAVADAVDAVVNCVDAEAQHKQDDDGGCNHHKSRRHALGIRRCCNGEKQDQACLHNRPHPRKFCGVIRFAVQNRRTDPGKQYYIVYGDKHRPHIESTGLHLVQVGESLCKIVHHLVSLLVSSVGPASSGHHLYYIYKRIYCQ